MQHQKCSLELYTNFLISNQNRYSGTELSKNAPNLSHDHITRWLAHAEYTPGDLWKHAQPLVAKETGYLIGDDSLLSKKFSRENELAKLQYSGNAHGLQNGICLVNVLWTNGAEYIPVDYRIYQKENDDKTRNDHFQDMLKRAQKRGFKPCYVLMDSWYGGVENLKLITKELNWDFICNLKSNRKVCVTKGLYVSVSDLPLADKQVRKVWLKEYGYVLVCKLVDKDGGITYLATNDLHLTEYDEYREAFSHRWTIEEFHRGIKQTTGIEKRYATRAASQKTHIFASFVAFVKLETARVREKVSWYEQKAIIGRAATTAYLLQSA
ncbi:MAG: transposase [Parcubacteria group bacterium Greene0416_79]|nr:MAG: transposase [Parcubacteria group bacterium Greene0416_79]